MIPIITADWFGQNVTPPTDPADPIFDHIPLSSANIYEFGHDSGTLLQFRLHMDARNLGRISSQTKFYVKLHHSSSYVPHDPTLPVDVANYVTVENWIQELRIYDPKIGDPKTPEWYRVPFEGIFIDEFWPPSDEALDTDPMDNPNFGVKYKASELAGLLRARLGSIPACKDLELAIWVNRPASKALSVEGEYGGAAFLRGLFENCTYVFIETYESRFPANYLPSFSFDYVRSEIIDYWAGIVTAEKMRSKAIVAIFNPGMVKTLRDGLSDERKKRFDPDFIRWYGQSRTLQGGAPVELPCNLTAGISLHFEDPDTMQDPHPVPVDQKPSKEDLIEFDQVIKEYLIMNTHATVGIVLSFTVMRRPAHEGQPALPPQGQVLLSKYKGHALVHPGRKAFVFDIDGSPECQAWIQMLLLSRDTGMPVTIKTNNDYTENATEDVVIQYITFGITSFPDDTQAKNDANNID